MVPVTIKSSMFQYKDTNGEYVGVDAIADKTTAEQVAQVNSAISAKITEMASATATNISAIETKGQQTLDSIPEDYTELSEDVENLKSALGTVPSGKTAQGQITDNASDIADLESAIDSMPTEETGQELLLQEIYNTGLTDTALTVIGMIFNNLPQDEPAVDIVHSLELECERLQAIYENWMSERSA